MKQVHRKAGGVEHRVTEKTSQRGVIRSTIRRGRQAGHYYEGGRTYSRYERVKDHAQEHYPANRLPGGCPVYVAFGSPETSSYLVWMWVE